MKEKKDLAATLPRFSFLFVTGRDGIEQLTNGVGTFSCVQMREFRIVLFISTTGPSNQHCAEMNKYI